MVKSSSLIYRTRQSQSPYFKTTIFIPPNVTEDWRMMPGNPGAVLQVSLVLHFFILLLYRGLNAILLILFIFVSNLTTQQFSSTSRTIPSWSKNDNISGTLQRTLCPTTQFTVPKLSFCNLLHPRKHLPQPHFRVHPSPLVLHGQTIQSCSVLGTSPQFFFLLPLVWRCAFLA